MDGRGVRPGAASRTGWQASRRRERMNTTAGPTGAPAPAVNQFGEPICEEGWRNDNLAFVDGFLQRCNVPVKVQDTLNVVVVTLMCVATVLNGRKLLSLLCKPKKERTAAPAVVLAFVGVVVYTVGVGMYFLLINFQERAERWTNTFWLLGQSGAQVYRWAVV